MTYLKKQKARLEELSNNISERLTGRKPVRNEVTSERVYCRIISVGRIDRVSEANEVDEELLVLSAIYYIIDRDRERERERERETDRQTDRQTNRQTDKQTNKQTDRQTDRQTDKQTDGQTDRQTDRQTGRQTDRDKERVALLRRET